jgi:hypothetical protein
LNLTTDLDDSTYVWDIIKGSHSLSSDPVIVHISTHNSARYLAGAACSASSITDPDISGKLSLNFPESPPDYSGWLALDTKIVIGDELTTLGDNSALGSHRADINTEVTVHLSSSSP